VDQVHDTFTIAAMNYVLLALVCVVAAIFLPRIYRR
jgi:hypothetical protein